MPRWSAGVLPAARETASRRLAIGPMPGRGSQPRAAPRARMREGPRAHDAGAQPGRRFPAWARPWHVRDHPGRLRRRERRAWLAWWLSGQFAPVAGDPRGRGPRRRRSRRCSARSAVRRERVPRDGERPDRAAVHLHLAPAGHPPARTPLLRPGNPRALEVRAWRTSGRTSSGTTGGPGTSRHWPEPSCSTSRCSGGSGGSSGSARTTWPTTVPRRSARPRTMPSTSSDSPRPRFVHRRWGSPSAARTWRGGSSC